MAHLKDAPAWPLVLGFGGLIPFFVGPLLWFIGGPVSVAAHMALPLYGAMILTFLNGGRWAAELVLRADAPRPLILIESVSIMLIAWAAALTILWPQELHAWGLNFKVAAWVVLVFGFALQYLIDRTAVREAMFARWYGDLRVWLSLGAISSMGVGAALTYYSV